MASLAEKRKADAEESSVDALARPEAVAHAATVAAGRLIIVDVRVVRPKQLADENPASVKQGGIVADVRVVQSERAVRVNATTAARSRIVG